MTLFGLLPCLKERKSLNNISQQRLIQRAKRFGDDENIINIIKIMALKTDTDIAGFKMSFAV